MARWPEWFRCVGDGATNPRALDVGKKLLGYLAVRRQTPGVQTLTKRVVLDDGTVVEASFYGDQPQVTVYSPDGLESCELYVESGLLDLGPNIAPDANKRFNRGVPEFDDKPATLHFGDGVDCKAGEAGLNGKVRVNPRTKTLASECLPKQGRSVKSRLTDPKKKQAQALLPASCWSGLMQRYVQAVYGGTALKYSATKETLTVAGIPIGPLGSCCGMVEVGGSHYFIFAGSDAIAAAPLKFKDSCGEAVYAAWKVAAKEKQDGAEKLLTIAFSQAYPDVAKSEQIGDANGAVFTSPYGWQFSEKSPIANAVTLVDKEFACLVELRIERSYSGQLAATVSEQERARLPPMEVACSVSTPLAGPVRIARVGGDDMLKVSETYDHPVSCYYESGALVVVRYSLDASTSAPAYTDGAHCKGSRFIRLPNKVAAEYDCGLSNISKYNVNPHDRFVDPEKQRFVKYMAGLYATKRNVGVVWSDVGLTDGMLLVRTENSDGFTGEYISGDALLFASASYSIPAGTKSEKDEVNSGPHDIMTSDPWFGEDLYPEEPKCGVRELYAHCSSSDALDGKCTLAAAPDLSFGAGEYWHHISVTWEGTSSGPCRYLSEMQAAPDFVIGNASELAISSGDCSSIIAMRFDRSGFDASKHGTGTYNDKMYKTCIHARYDGVATVSCTGWEYEGHIHGPHMKHVSFSEGYSGDEIGSYFDRSVEYSLESNYWQMRLTSRSATISGSNIARRVVTGEDMKVASSVRSFYSDTGILTSRTATEDIAYFAPEHGVTCEHVKELMAPLQNKKPTMVAISDSDEKSLEELIVKYDSPGVTQRGYSYLAMRGILGDTVYPENPFEFGASINMDRQTITGGYPKVSTPSFVGWA